VDSCVRSNKSGLEVLDERLALVGAGESGKTASSSEKTGTGVEGTKTGKVVVECGGDGDDADDSEDGGDGALACPWGKAGRRPTVGP
jgi:hypothetical protein